MQARLLNQSYWRMTELQAFMCTEVVMAWVEQIRVDVRIRQSEGGRGLRARAGS